MKHLLFLSTFCLLVSTATAVDAYEGSDKSSRWSRESHAEQEGVLGDAKYSLLSPSHSFSKGSFEEGFSRHANFEYNPVRHDNRWNFSQEYKTNFYSHGRHEGWGFSSVEVNNHHRWDHVLDDSAWTRKFNDKHLGWDEDRRFFCTDPVPEPESYAMLLVGIVFVLGFVSRINNVSTKK